jgi:radical SAM protein with 4Fe4S-binding SPASM domain
MDCINVPSINYGEFSKRLQSKTLNPRMPVNGTIDITSRCNLRCVHCYIQGTCFGDELTYPEICHILDQITEEGCLWLVITGGEPLTRSDFKDIYKYAKGKGLFITLFTNGNLLTPEIADFLADLPPFAIEISLYGMSQHTYEGVTGVTGSFERCLRGIKLVHERGLYLRLKSMVFPSNYHELKEMRQFADNMGVPFRFDCMINARLDGSMAPAEYRLSPDKIVALDFISDKWVKEWQDFIDRFGGMKASNSLYNCGAGLNNFHIDSTGHLGVCAVSREPGYDLRCGTFHDGFFNAILEVRAKKRTRYSECQTCESIGICPQCPAWGQLEHGDPEAKVDFLCQVTRLRVAALRDARERH